jgi:hypothetical protein
MLLTKEQIATLKKNLNVSKNADKTKERVQADFKTATKAERKEIIDLSGQNINSIYRIYNTGSVNARILMALSQVLKVQPWYYTGEIDERAEMDEGQIGQFLKVHGYDDLSKELGRPAGKRKYERKVKVADDEAVTPTVTETQLDNGEDTSVQVTAETEQSAICETAGTKEVRVLFADTPQFNKAVKELNEQEAIELLHTLFIRAKGGGEAANLADIVKRCLLK